MNRKNNQKPSTYAATYEEAGVNIDAGNRLVEAIKPHCKATSRPGTMAGLGGFGALFDLKQAGYRDPLLVSGTDGVGTKIKVAEATGDYSTIGQDLVAMCVNDLVVQGAEPLFFLDYYACGKLQVDQAATVIKGIAEGCRLAGCALIGGETAEMPGLYREGDIDLAGFAVGAVERDALLPRVEAMQAGDALLGLPSSGLHSNGFSLVRKLVETHGFDYRSAAPEALGFDGPLGALLLTPTRIYVRACLEAIKTSVGIKGLAHITGGGLSENIPRILPETLAAEIDLNAWRLPPLFAWLQRLGQIEDAELRRTFNCGIGMVMIVEEAQAAHLMAGLAAAGEAPVRLGRLIPRTEAGVVYRSGA